MLQINIASGINIGSDVRLILGVNWAFAWRQRFNIARRSERPATRSVNINYPIPVRPACERSRSIDVV